MSDRRGDGAGRRIGLYGGTFDPPHLAHLALARAARAALALDEFRFVPTGQPWQKTGTRAITPAAHRVAMLEAMLAAEPDRETFVIDPVEIERDGPSYTIDTVEALAARAHERSSPTEWWLVIGSDQVGRLQTWHRWRDLLARVKLAVAARPGSPLEPAPEVAAELAAQGASITPVPMAPQDVSASDIRHRVAAGLPYGHLVAPAVAGYIARQRLYARA